MNELVKLKCTTRFFDLKNGAVVDQGDELERPSERAAILVAKGFCSVISRTKLGDSSVTDTEVKPPVLEKTKPTIDKKVDVKPVKKPAAKPVAKPAVKTTKKTS